MIVSVKVTSEFERQAKRFAKKYKSFAKDFALFLADIKNNPYQGIDLGGGKRKVRMAIASKGKGKSGGMRVITFNVCLLNENDVVVNLITIYDKQEISNISEQYINQIIRAMK